MLENDLYVAIDNIKYYTKIKDILMQKIWEEEQLRISKLLFNGDY